MSSATPTDGITYLPIFKPQDSETKDVLLPWRRTIGENRDRILSYAAEVQALVVWLWPAFDGRRIPLGELKDYRKSHDILLPSCMCALAVQGPSPYTEAALFVAKSRNVGIDQKYVFACASNSCGYFIAHLEGVAKLREYPTYTPERRALGAPDPGPMPTSASVPVTPSGSRARTHRASGHNEPRTPASSSQAFPSSQPSTPTLAPPPSTQPRVSRSQLRDLMMSPLSQSPSTNSRNTVKSAPSAPKATGSRRTRSEYQGSSDNELDNRPTNRPRVGALASLEALLPHGKFEDGETFELHIEAIPPKEPRGDTPLDHLLDIARPDGSSGAFASELQDALLKCKRCGLIKTRNSFNWHMVPNHCRRAIQDGKQRARTPVHRSDLDLLMSLNNTDGLAGAYTDELAEALWKCDRCGLIKSRSTFHHHMCSLNAETKEDGSFIIDLSNLD
ncbi:hypothetical protein BKA70DRAFT_1233745 [Coprinopsis sp. MPI-PUGE-AT-0042]|nr:hypothetical protein BKA70DRAFT_1440885 [Coprinopsis sp. MPI-PUGE-AT-0042]KAH6891948.1 hypothetical protein BKA70DRAFT_1233745 [Coprinopsis sp. MPI-PUGE-AT-0042]